MTKLDSVRWTIGKSTIDGPEAKVFLCSDVYTIMVEATQASRKRTSNVRVDIASPPPPPPPPSLPKPGFGIKPSANPGRVKASANPVSDGKQSCFGAWVTLGLSVLPPETKLKSVRWTVGKSTIDGPEAKVLLCSTSKDKPD